MANSSALYRLARAICTQRNYTKRATRKAMLSMQNYLLSNVAQEDLLELERTLALCRPKKLGAYLGKHGYIRNLMFAPPAKLDQMFVGSVLAQMYKAAEKGAGVRGS